MGDYELFDMFYNEIQKIVFHCKTYQTAHNLCIT